MIKMLLALLLVSPAWADELYVPATPPALSEDVVTGYHIDELKLHSSLDGNTAGIEVILTPIRAGGLCARDPGGRCKQVTCTWRGTAASTMQNVLNTANLTSNSLRKRVLTQCAEAGFLPAAGTVSGTPGIPAVPTPLPTFIPS